MLNIDENGGYTTAPEAQLMVMERTRAKSIGQQPAAASRIMSPLLVSGTDVALYLSVNIVGEGPSSAGAGLW